MIAETCCKPRLQEYWVTEHQLLSIMQRLSLSIVTSKVKCDHRSKFSNLSNWKEEAWKNSGLQRDSNPWPLQYRCDALPTELWSHTLGARSIYWVHIFPCSEMMWSLYEIISYKLHIVTSSLPQCLRKMCKQLWMLEKDVCHLITSVGQRKNYESPWGIEPQTFGFRAPILYHLTTETLR